MKLKVVLVIVMFIVLLVVFAWSVESQNMELHVIGSTKTFKVYKMVHAGCEIFVVSAEGFQLNLTKEYPPTVAIATGRSCK